MSISFTNSYFNSFKNVGLFFINFKVLFTQLFNSYHSVITLKYKTSLKLSN